MKSEAKLFAMPTLTLARNTPTARKMIMANNVTNATTAAATTTRITTTIAAVTTAIAATTTTANINLINCVDYQQQQQQQQFQSNNHYYHTHPVANSPHFDIIATAAATTIAATATIPAATTTTTTTNSHAVSTGSATFNGNSISNAANGSIGNANNINNSNNNNINIHNVNDNSSISFANLSTNNSNKSETSSNAGSIIASSIIGSNSLGSLASVGGGTGTTNGNIISSSSSILNKKPIMQSPINNRENFMPNSNAIAAVNLSANSQMSTATATAATTSTATLATTTNLTNNNNNAGNIFEHSQLPKGNKDTLLQNYYNGDISSETAAQREAVVDTQRQSHNDPGDGLGPLPAKWETAYTERGELYFIDHNTGTSHWLDPRLSKYQKKSLEDCGDNELPYGWEKIEDSLYGTYYIDHVNRRTQYENPVLEAKRRAAEQTQKQTAAQRSQTPSSMHMHLNGDINDMAMALPSTNLTASNSGIDISQRAMQPPPPPPPIIHVHSASGKPLLPYKFTRNPAEVQGERISTTLVKSARGLGITIVGGDDGTDEFLQIKSIVPNGPAWLDAKLQMGDILLYVNDTCVLGFSHIEMVNVFQSIMPGETVTLEVVRGYPLPFDPNDPNTEVVTTIAVDGIASPQADKTAQHYGQQQQQHHHHHLHQHMLRNRSLDANYNFLDLSANNGSANLKTGLALNGANGGFILMKKPDTHTISIIKGAMGFGFTIADSAFGQKVKQILDRNCCTQLEEGDVLVEINEMNVRNKTHLEVVQILKDCSKTEPTTVKIERSSATQTTHSPTSLAYNFNSSVSGNVAKLRKNFVGGTGSIFRSKTPTADLYSTQPKEILPIRPKTPLVDTRRARVRTPNNELADDTAVAAAAAAMMVSADNLDGNLNCNLNDNKTHADAKSQNSLQEMESIHQNIPYLDPYPKMLSSLGERLAEVRLRADPLNAGNLVTNPYNGGIVSNLPANYENQDYVSAGNYSQIYGIAQMPPTMNALEPLHYTGTGLVSTQYSPVAASLNLMTTPTHTYHHESCYCYECQDYRNAGNRLRQQSNYYAHQQSQYSPSLQAAHLQNERMQKRVNELLSDRRKVCFSPLDKPLLAASGASYNVSTMQQQQQQHSPAISSISQQPGANWSLYNTVPQMQALSANGLDIASEAGEHQYELSEVTLERQALGFGFRIIGGTEEGSQVTVGHVVPGGAADNDHRINSGDEILSIDGINVVNSSHHKVVSLMGEAALRGHVNMILRRRICSQLPAMHQSIQHASSTLPSISFPSQQLLSHPHAHQHHSPQPQTQIAIAAAAASSTHSTLRYPYDVIVNRLENEGFGFVIISSSNQYYGSTIGKLISGSPAERCGELKVGDRIIAVNRIDIAGMSHGDVVNLIKESGLHVRLTIGCPKELVIGAASGTANASAAAAAGGGGSISGSSGNTLLLNSAQASPSQLSTTQQSAAMNTQADDSNYFEQTTGSGGNNLAVASAHHPQL